MDKRELLKQINDALANGKDIKKVKVKYTDGQVIKFTFDGDEGEVQTEVEEDDETDVADEDEDEEEEEEDDEDDEEKEDNDEVEEDAQDAGVSNQVVNNSTSDLTSPPAGRRVNVINR